MKAIKIDPVAKTVTEIVLKKDPNEDLKELYGIIGCTLVEMVYIDAGSIYLIVDEEGRCKEIKGAFKLSPGDDAPVYAGIGILLSTSDDTYENELKDISWTVEEISRGVRWVDPADVPEPHCEVITEPAVIDAYFGGAR